MRFAKSKSWVTENENFLLYNSRKTFIINLKQKVYVSELITYVSNSQMYV